MRKTLILLFMSFLTLTGWSDNYKTIKDVSYIDPNETSAYRRERCKLDIYYPEGQTGFKTIVWFHGGALRGGSKNIPDPLKEKDVAVVPVNYRLYPQCKNPDYTVDAAQAVAWVYKHIKEYGGDPNKVYVAGHSAGGYLTLMLALDKSYLQQFGVDADSIRAYFPLSGQCATHYTIRTERNISFEMPIVDKYAPLNNARKMGTHLFLITGDRTLEQMARYEENLYLKAVLEGVGNKEIPIYELKGFDHGEMHDPGCMLINKLMKKY